MLAKKSRYQLHYTMSTHSILFVRSVSLQPISHNISNFGTKNNHLMFIH